MAPPNCLSSPAAPPASAMPPRGPPRQAGAPCLLAVLDAPGSPGAPAAPGGAGLAPHHLTTRGRVCRSRPALSLGLGISYGGGSPPALRRGLGSSSWTLSAGLAAAPRDACPCGGDSAASPRRRAHAAPTPVSESSLRFHLIYSTWQCVCDPLDDPRDVSV